MWVLNNRNYLVFKVSVIKLERDSSLFIFNLFYGYWFSQVFLTFFDSILSIPILKRYPFHLYFQSMSLQDFYKVFLVLTFTLSIAKYLLFLLLSVFSLFLIIFATTLFKVTLLCFYWPSKLVIFFSIPYLSMSIYILTSVFILFVHVGLICSLLAFGMSALVPLFSSFLVSIRFYGSLHFDVWCSLIITTL